MMPKQSVLQLYKSRGETPLGCINRFKKDNPEYVEDKMTYAGRLDPLAEGLLLVLVGEECKNKEKYLGLDKEYELVVLFGFATDSFDVLGKVEKIGELRNNSCFASAWTRLTKIIPQFSGHGSLNNINNVLKSFVGKFSQKYPSFSSKTVDGIPLFAHAKSGTLDPEDIPSKDVEIKSIELLSEGSISKSELEKFVKESVALVSGDFRQVETLKSWESALLNTKQTNFKIITIKVSCTSGTYMRSLANLIGDKAGVSALALNIMRTRVGEYILTK